MWNTSRPWEHLYNPMAMHMSLFSTYTHNIYHHIFFYLCLLVLIQTQHKANYIKLN